MRHKIVFKNNSPKYEMCTQPNKWQKRELNTEPPYDALRNKTKNKKNEGNISLIAMDLYPEN